MSVASHPFVPLSTHGVMSNDCTAHNPAAPPAQPCGAVVSHLQPGFTPEDLEPALRRAELEPHVTPCAAHGGGSG